MRGRHGDRDLRERPPVARVRFGCVLHEGLERLREGIRVYEAPDQLTQLPHVLGVSCEIVDIRSLRPLDADTVAESPDR